MGEKAIKITNIISMCLMAVSSVFFALFSFVDYNSVEKSARIWSFTISSVFWIALIAAWVLRLVLYKQLKKNNDMSGKPGIITFFSNNYAKIADIVMITAFVLSVIFLFTGLPNIIKLIFISLFILGFQLHIALNGKVNKYII